jgi:colicin import membrane protein
MPASADRLQFAPPPAPGMLRALGFAIAAHVLLMLALTWGINWKRDPENLSAEAELWSRLPQEAAPRLVEVSPPPPPPPVPAPVEAPPPAPVVAPPAPAPEPAPRAADIALEREKEELADARRKQLALEREKKREERKELAAEKLQADKERLAQRKLEERKLEERKAAETAKEAAVERQKLETTKKLRQADDARRLQAQREANLRRMQGLANSTGGPESIGGALHSSGPSSSYGGRIRARVKPNIVFGEEIAGNPTAEVEVRTAPDGTIVSQRISKSSGVRSWDEAVLKAVIKTEVLPRDIDGRVPSSLIISFRPKD